MASIIQIRRLKMDFAELIKTGACATDIQQYLVEGDATAITVRIPQNLRDAAKEVVP